MRSPLHITLHLAMLSLIGCASGEAHLFREVAREVGIDFRFDRARDRDYFMPDSLAAGCAFLDYDGDGDLDVYIVNGYRSTDGKLKNPEGANRLYRQESDGTFTDVTEPSGAGDRGYGMGVAVGDIDNDGDADVYLANYGPDVLLLNRGDGTFVDVTRRAGLGDPRWGASAGFFDYDGDGFLDIFVTHYLDYDPEMRAVDSGGRPEYPGPDCCPGVADSLYHNDGDGTFTDVTEQAGIGAASGKGLGVTFWDIDGNGRIDVYVANDGEPNNAWLQLEPGVFTDRGVETGLALNVYGTAEASMGVALGDLDGDLAPELFLTHIARETNTLYQEEGRGLFRDATLGSGLGAPSADFIGFGTAILDYDLDGDLDLLIVNGRVLRGPQPADDHWTPYAEPNLLFENDGAGSFREVTGSCGSLCSVADVSRGLAVGDVDGDGDPDVLLSGGDGRVRLFRNLLDGGAHWLGVRTLVAPSGRDAHGAEVYVAFGERRLRRDISPVAGYLSSHDARVSFGLGSRDKVDDVRVRWPDGASESFGALPVDRWHVLARGAGRRLD